MDWSVFTQGSSLQIQVHWVAAALAFFLGLIILFRTKGTKAHKTLGWTYVAVMAIVTVTAVFIRDLPKGASVVSLEGFSPIHALIPITVFGLFGGLRAIRKGDRRSHARRMVITFFAALVVAGLFTFVPGRRMHQLFFGAPAPAERSAPN
ncbi:MAG: DUF2306 domain-containing protein [Alphaproteobacteria bacterium]